MISRCLSRYFPYIFQGLAEQEGKMKEYLQKYRGQFAVLGAFVFLLHGAKLNTNVLGIDSEALIRLKDGFYHSWFVTGRQGRVLLKYLLGNSSFNPYFNAVMTLLLFVVSSAAFFLLWDRIWEGGKAACRLSPWIWGGLLWISHPIMTEQFYFSLQSMEVLISFLLTAAALYFSFRWAECMTARFCGAGGVFSGSNANVRSGKGYGNVTGRAPAGNICAVAAVLLLVLTFSNYQVFVAIYIFGVVSVLLLQGFRELAEGKEIRPRILFTRVGLYLIIFLTAFLTNTVITNLFFSSSDYIQNQVLWSFHRPVDCLRNMCGHVFKVFTGYNSIFFNPVYGVLCIVSLILAVCIIKRFCRKKGTGAVLLFFWLALQTTPFLMSIFLGGAPVIRSQLVLPVMTGFLAYLDFRFLELLGPAEAGKSAAGIVWAGLTAACLAGGMCQTKTTEALYYTDRCRYEQDEAMGYAMIERIRQVNPQGGELPVMVIGKKEFEGNNSCVTGEVMGTSFFDYDLEAEPRQFWSTWRVLGFLHTLGADFPQLTEERIPEAVEYSTDMPCWPAEGSVQIKDGMIIVKLSDEE